MDDATYNTTNGGETGESQASESTPTTPSEPAYSPHETDRGPSSGRTTRAIYPDADQPSGDMPKPELAGQYAPENIIAYGKKALLAGDQPGAYDFNAALQSVVAKPQTYGEFIQNVPAEHLPGLVDLARNFIAHDPENVIRELIAMNHLPTWILPPAGGVINPNDPTLADLQPELQAFVIDNIEPQMWDELALMAPEIRDSVLQEKMELAQMKQQEYQQRAETAVTEWNWQMDDIENNSRYAILDAVGSLQPFTEDAANEKAQDYCILATWAQVTNDPHLQELRELAGQGFRQAAEERWRGNEKMAKGREHHARQMLAELDREFKAKLDANIKQFQAFFQHAPGRREAPAQTDQQQYIN
jgi:hypothetical protein